MSSIRSLLHGLYRYPVLSPFATRSRYPRRPYVQRRLFDTPIEEVPCEAWTWRGRTLVRISPIHDDALFTAILVCTISIVRAANPNDPDTMAISQDHFDELGLHVPHAFTMVKNWIRSPLAGSYDYDTLHDLYGYVTWTGRDLLWWMGEARRRVCARREAGLPTRWAYTTAPPPLPTLQFYPTAPPPTPVSPLELNSVPPEYSPVQGIALPAPAHSTVASSPSSEDEYVASAALVPAFNADLQAVFGSDDEEMSDANTDASDDKAWDGISPSDCREIILHPTHSTYAEEHPDFNPWAELSDSDDESDSSYSEDDYVIDSDYLYQFDANEFQADADEFFGDDDEEVDSDFY